MNKLPRERIRQSEFRSLRAHGKNAVFNAGCEQLGSSLLRERKPLRLNQGASILRNTIEFILQRWESGPGHNLHTYIIAAISGFAPLESSGSLMSWQDMAAMVGFAGARPRSGFCIDPVLPALAFWITDNIRFSPSS